MNETSNLKFHFLNQSPISKIVIQEFNKPLFENKFFLYIDTLRYDADIVKFSKNKWENNTLQFCQDEYSDQYLFPIIHLANSINTIYEFNSENLPIIIKPKLSTINYIARKVY